MYILDFLFAATLPVHTLPKWHGARWSAWLREAGHMGAVPFDDAVIALLPWRHGQKPIRRDERIWLRLLLADNALYSLGQLVKGLACALGTGEFAGDSFRLEKIADPFSGAVIWENGQFTSFLPQPFDEELLADETGLLCGLDEWSLIFAGPMRLPLPGGHEKRGKGQEKFCPPDFLLSWPGLCHMLAKTRLPGAAPDGLAVTSAPCLVDAALQWEDLRYSRQRQVALGGVTGWLKWRGCPGSAAARLLVLGQYVGAGKNGRFGLGFWRIPELEAFSRFPER